MPQCFKGQEMKTKTPNPIDVYVGSKVRLQRQMLHMSQSTLAGSLGITFQQVQKYEKGTNRIGASRLQAISGILGVPVGFFFKDTESDPVSMSGIETAYMPDGVTQFLGTLDGIKLNRAFLAIKDEKVRRSVVGLVKALANSADMPDAHMLDEESKGSAAHLN